MVGGAGAAAGVSNTELIKASNVNGGAIAGVGVASAAKNQARKFK